MNLKNIFVPIDFSSNSNNALRYAIQFAEVTKSKLVVFHSNYIPSSFPSSDLKKIIAESEGRKQLMLEYTVNTICKKYKLKAPISITYVVERETAVVKNILSAATSTNCDLIIMGTHGASGFKKIMFGSITAGVIEKSNGAVLAIPPRHKFKHLETIIYASDLKNISKELTAVIPFAKPFNASIEVLYLNYWDKKIDEKTLSRLGSAIKSQPYKKINFKEKQVTIERTMVEHLAKYTKKHKASILSMFPENQSFFEKVFFGSITKKISFKLSKPLLSIRKQN